jgi:hypothetical protein
MKMYIYSYENPLLPHDEQLFGGFPRLGGVATNMLQLMFDDDIYSGWWFGTFGLFFPSYWECHHPN